MTAQGLLRRRRVRRGAADAGAASASACTCGEGATWFVSAGRHHGPDGPLFRAED